MQSTPAFREVAPRVFEVALHYASALTRGDFSSVLGQDQAAGVAVEELGDDALPDAALHALEDLDAGRYSVISSRLGTATVDCETATGHGRREACAVLDAALGGRGWFLAARLLWSARTFSDMACLGPHDHIVIVCDGAGGEARVVRPLFDDAHGAGAGKVVRDSLLRDLVLRPAFGMRAPSNEDPGSLTHTGDDEEATHS